MAKVEKLFLSASLRTLARGQLQGHGSHLKATINSCRKNTDLEIYVLWSGEKNDYYDWMEDKVKLVDISDFPIHKAVMEVPVPEVWNQGMQNIGMGAWGRVDLPSVFEKLDISDEYALYTDIDVLFTEKWNPQFNPIPTLGLCYESRSKTDYNTGVMIVNCEYLKSTFPEFKKYILGKGIANFQVWDQSAINEFYGSEIQRLNQSIWNWTPYHRTTGEDARIIHFHGPKINYLKDRIEKGILEPLHHEVYGTLFDRAPEKYKEAFEQLKTFL
jgi:hypothetical protein